MPVDAWNRRLFIGGAALAQLAIWLLTRPEVADSAAPTVTWLVGEASAAVVIGATAAPDGRAARAVLLGWALQMVHFVVVAPKGEEDNLWAVGLVVQSFLAAVAVGIALLAYLVSQRFRGPRG